MALINLNEKGILPTWATIDVNPSMYYCWKFDSKEIYLKRLQPNWFFSELESLETPVPSLSSDQLENSTIIQWSTFVGNQKSTIRAIPAFPNRPLVLKPSTPLKILPQNELLVFVNVPCRVQFYSGTPSPEGLIFETVVKTLSSTWFGEPDNGVLAYSIPFETSEALIKPLNQNSQTILCPIRLYNSSQMALDVQRLLLQSEYLNIYCNSNNELCANEVQIKFKGENVLSDVEYLNTIPNHISDAELLTPAQTAKSNNVLSKSFHFIKSLTNS